MDALLTEGEGVKEKRRISWPFQRILVWCLLGISAAQAGLAIYLAYLNHLNLNRIFAEYVVAMFVATLAFASVGALLALQRPENRIGWLLVIAGLVSGMIAWGTQYTRYTMVTNPGSLPGGPIVTWLNFWIWVPWTASFAIFLPLIFPDGRLLSRRWRLMAWLATAAVVLLSISLGISPGPVDAGLPEVMNPLALPGADRVVRWIEAPATLLILASLAGAVAAAIVRFRRSSGVEHQQLKWFTAGLTVLVACHVVPPLMSLPDFTSDTLKSGIALSVGFLLLPLSVGVAILRYRLYDIDLVIRRTLVYGALTGGIVIVYVFVVGYLGAIFRVQNNLLISLIAAGVVAVIFQPLRLWLQRLVNRLMYGERDDPYAILSRLGRHLETTLTPDSVLPTIVGTVKDSLKLPYAAISIQLEPQNEADVTASAGAPEGKVLEIPLLHQNETVGRLMVGCRRGEDDFSAADRRVLNDLARQAGVAVYAVRLTLEIQRARQRLVNAREEERRRIRRDLHDGLGSALAALHLQAAQLRTLMKEDPPAADALVIEWRAGLRLAIADIRRLVYDLRPPALDELGLVDALRARATQYAAGGSLAVSVYAPEMLPDLPAAAEVAAYRIVEEALANVAHHAHARSCTVQLAIAQGLVLEIRDDGVGLPNQFSAGAGLHSMQTRAEELGGSWAIRRAPEGGTIVTAWLPLPAEGRE